MTSDAGPIRLGKVVEQRIKELGLEYSWVAREADFSVETLSKIRKGVRVRGATYRRLERVLRWAADSADAVMAGGEPTPLPDAADGEEPVVAALPVEELAPDRRVDAIMTILEDLPPRVQAEVLRRLEDRVPASALRDLEAKSRGRKAG
ncbi:hypothetical protein [Streptomyces sp. NPDC096153]|uniref:hypothetical protein n=1 Tax=Streptomyces sp. NPDC096153 TaxID=3155548 RepID=UPI00332F9F61